MEQIRREAAAEGLIAGPILITSTLEEFVEIQQLSEVEETLKELPTTECLPFVNFKAVEMCCDTHFSKHKACLVCLFL